MKNSLLIKVIFPVTLATITPLLVSLFIIHDPIFSIITGVLMAAVSAIWIFLFLEPLSDLIKATQNFAEGNFNQRVDIRSGDEFEEIGKSFNNTALKISQTFQTLERSAEVAISQKNKISEVLSSIVDGIIVLDFNKNVTVSNKAAWEITGFTEQEVQGQAIDKFIHLFIDKEEINSNSYCQVNFNKPVTLVGKNGRQTKVNLMSAKMEGTVQNNLSCILILHDLSKEEELERMKLDFVSMASHELKTPLTSIIGYLSVFSSENKEKIAKEDMDLIGRALIASQQLQILVQNLLNVNKIEREQLSVFVQPLDYLPILTKTVEDIRSQAVEKNISLNFNPSASIPKILADPIRTAEVLTNLLVNAINYTPSGGTVSLSIEASPNEVTTMVSDSGIGIPKEAIPHLFNKFFRVSNQLQQANKGTGLGLYISRSIVEKSGGKIWVDSEPEKGSKFYFTLPLAERKSAGSFSNGSTVGQQIQSGTLNY